MKTSLKYPNLRGCRNFFYNLQHPLVFWCVRRGVASRKKIAGRFSEPGPGASESVKIYTLMYIFVSFLWFLAYFAANSQTAKQLKFTK